MKLHWTQAALADLEAVEAYISRHSPRYSLGMIERIFDRANQLDDHPLLGAVVPEYGDNSIREVLETPYRIIYRVQEEGVMYWPSSTLRARCPRDCKHSYGTAARRGG